MCMNVVATHLWHPPAEKKIHLQKNKRSCQIGRKINKKIISNEFFVDSKCFSKKEFIYTCSWYERFKLKPKEFSSYSQITTVEKCEPTINSVLENLPANELVQWLKDVGVLSSNSSISDGELPTTFL